MKTLIIDDEPLAHDVILAYAKDVDYINIVGQFHLATDALSFLRTETVDLIFLDINMPKLKGLDFLRTLMNPPIIIITSAYEEYALESFELKVCDYLLKPFRFSRFLKATQTALELFELKNQPSEKTQQLAVNLRSKNTKHIFIKSDKKLIQIDLAAVYYMESYGNYVKVWLDNEYILTPRTLSSFEEQLPKTDFFRIHKSFIINKKYINFVEGNMVTLKNEQRLTIGKSQRSAFKLFIL